MHGLQRLPECAAISRIRVEQSHTQVEQRNVVIARNRNERHTEPINEASRRAKLELRRALGDVPREHQQIGPLLARQRDQRLDHRQLFAAKVRIRDLQQHAHTLPNAKLATSGLSRKSGRGATRKSSGARMRLNSPSNATFTLRPYRAGLGVTIMR